MVIPRPLATLRHDGVVDEVPHLNYYLRLRGAEGHELCTAEAGYGYLLVLVENITLWWICAAGARVVMFGSNDGVDIKLMEFDIPAAEGMGWRYRHPFEEWFNDHARAVVRSGSSICCGIFRMNK